MLLIPSGAREVENEVEGNCLILWNMGRNRKDKNSFLACTLRPSFYLLERQDAIAVRELGCDLEDPGSNHPSAMKLSASPTSQG